MLLPTPPFPEATTMILLTMNGKVKAIEECKVSLLSYFGLRPSKYPMPSSMIICGHMDEGCCSMEDELRIHALWQKYSNSQIRRHIDTLINGYSILFERHDQLINMNFKQMMISSNEERKIPVRFKVCERIATQLNGDNDMVNGIDLLNNSDLLDKPGFRKELLMKNFDFEKNFKKIYPLDFR